MLENIIYFKIFGKPLIMYSGIITLISFLLTAAIGISNRRMIGRIPFKWHPRMAAISIGLALIHGISGILAYF